jgi:hypothetical protein
MLVAGVCSSISGSALGQTPDQQRLDPAPARQTESPPRERDIFVPLWTEPVGSDKALPANVRRQRADYVWSAVPPVSSAQEATYHPKGSTAVLLSLRPVSLRAKNPIRDGFEVTVRVERPVARSTRPFLEVVDTTTLLQSRAWGNLVRRTTDGAEWVFRLLDPVAVPPGPRNEISARVLRTPDPNRKLELRLVAEAQAP